MSRTLLFGLAIAAAFPLAAQQAATDPLSLARAELLRAASAGHAVVEWVVKL